MASATMIKPWPLISSKVLEDYRVFKVRTDWRVSPRTGTLHDFFVIEAPSWVNVVAITPDEKIVLVEQFRHGTATIELEVPGGVMDVEDASPVATGVRELREETGYEGSTASLLGEVHPNPAIMDNTCYTVLVKGCELRHPVAFDCGEDLATQLVPVTDIPGLLAAGRIRHSLVVVALHHFLSLRGTRS